MLSNGITPNVVMEFTGHKDIKSLSPYSGITHNAVVDAVAVLNNVIGKDKKGVKGV